VLLKATPGIAASATPVDVKATAAAATVQILRMSPPARSMDRILREP